MSEISSNFSNTFVIVSCIVGLVFGVWNWFKVMSIKTDNGFDLDPEKPLINKETTKTMNEIAGKIQKGAITFLLAEYLYLSIFIVAFGIVVLLTSEEFHFYTVIAFVLGALTSSISGYIGMFIATRANVRVTYSAAKNVNNTGIALQTAFNVAFRGGCVMGFFLVSLALLILHILIIVYRNIATGNHSVEIFEYIAGYGLGGSTVALFCRVGGGIYTKAADVGADLVGKNDYGFKEDDPKNPAVIADNVGDNVGDIAGMGSDLFGSFAESTCAALVIAGKFRELTGPDSDANFMFPLIISAAGILVCIVTSFFATNIMPVDEKLKIEKTLKWQLIISTIILIPTLILLSLLLVPDTLTHIEGYIYTEAKVKVMVCTLSGLISGLIIGYFTDYFTSNAHGPTQQLAQACKSGAAINIIHGLALGYLSCIIPIISIAATIYTSFKLVGMYGISLAALGMLSNLSIGLAIDAYGPISDNAGGISEMSGCDDEVRKITDSLDAAGNTTAAIGKGFAIGSACLVSLALFGAFVSRTNMKDVNILEPVAISSLLIGAMMPYAFSALTMKSVGSAASKMCDQVRAQVDANNNDPEECIKISTQASLREMIIPGIMVIFVPLFLGFLFGKKSISGYLAGVIVSGVQMAISASNSGGAWDNAKKYIEAKELRIDAGDRVTKDNEGKQFYEKGSEPHKAAVVGDTVGDPLKDTSGPSLNILIKLSAIVSLVFGSFFNDHAIFPDA